MSGLESSWPLAANAGCPLKSEVDHICMLMTCNPLGQQEVRGTSFPLMSNDEEENQL
jgi:hypothetical protein